MWTNKFNKRFLCRHRCYYYFNVFILHTKNPLHRSLPYDWGVEMSFHLVNISYNLLQTLVILNHGFVRHTWILVFHPANELAIWFSVSHLLHYIDKMFPCTSLVFWLCVQNNLRWSSCCSSSSFLHLKKYVPKPVPLPISNLRGPHVYFPWVYARELH